MRGRIAASLMVAALLGQAVGVGQQPQPTDPLLQRTNPQSKPALDGNSSPYRHADNSNPRETLRSFIDSCNELYEGIRSHQYYRRTSLQHRPLVRRVLDCLDDSQIPAFAREDRASEVAVCLKEILDRVEIPAWEAIPGADQLAERLDGSEPLTRWRLPGTRITISRIEEGPRKHDFLFSTGTVDRAVEYYEEIRDMPYRSSGPETSPGFYRWFFAVPGDPVVGALVNRLPEWTKNRVAGITAWKWPGLIILLLTSLGGLLFVYRIQRALAKRTRQASLFNYCLTILLPLAAILIPILLKSAVHRFLTLRGNPLYYVNFIADLAQIVACIVLAFAVSNRVTEIIVASPRIHPRGLDAQLFRIVGKIGALTAAVTIFLVGGQYLGIPLTTLVASAGVGGLAIALAAQDSLKTVFGTLTLMADKPFRVGDRILFKSYDGFVEDIGLRSTRVRLLNGHLATIPNDELARFDIENIGRRPHIRRLTNLQLPLETPRRKVSQAVEIVRSILKDHQGMDPELPPRVYFDDFTDSGFNIRMIYWFTPPDYWQFLEEAERINLAIFDAFEEHGIPFALPLRISETPSEQPGDRSPST